MQEIKEVELRSRRGKFIYNKTYNPVGSNNVSVKSKLQHPPPGCLTVLKIIVQIPLYPGQNAVQMPHTRVHSGDQMPPPRGHFTGTKMTEGRQKRLQLLNKIFINITNPRNTVSVFTTNKSLVQSGRNRCYEVTECSAFLRHATYKAFYKKRSHLLRLLHHDHFSDMHHRSPY